MFIQPRCNTIRPIGDVVAIRPIGYSEGKIILPDITREKMKTHRGVVVAVGPGRTDQKTGKFKPTQVKPGDEVVYAMYTDWQRDVDVTGEKLLMLREHDLLADVFPKSA